MEFYKGWLKNPKKIGAIAPTSSGMAKKMASVVRPDSGLPVLELGPGTGAITKAILERGVKPENLVSVEYSKTFLPSLNRRFPGVNFVYGDAFDIVKIAEEQGIKKFDSIVSGLPLLNFPLARRVRLVERLLKLLDPGRPFVQFSYGLVPPVPVRKKRYSVTHLDTVFRNLPPARIWVYQCSSASKEAKPEPSGEALAPAEPGAAGIA